MTTLTNPKTQLLSSEEMLALSNSRHKIRMKHPDSLILFRVGDFYHLTGDDAAYYFRITD